MFNRVTFLSSLLLLTSLQGMRAVQYDVTNVDPSSPGGIIFANDIGLEYTRQTLEAASGFIWQTFQQTTEASRKSVQRVGLVVEDTTPVLDVPAYALDDVIHLNTKYIEGYSGDVKREVTGIVYHEATHVWQWNGNGQPTPGGLIEGIADYIRLKAGLAPSHWRQPGAGERWDQGYDITARFLDYCNGLKDGFVAQLNGKMRDGYSDNFFVELL